MKKLSILLIVLILTSCINSQNKIDIQGHRGARGLYPENSIAGFMEALKLGVNTLELDLVVSADSELVVSHEPYFSPLICQNENGAAFSEDSIINIYQLNYSEIKTFDCGSKDHPWFPEQTKIATKKPLLEDVFSIIEEYIKQNHLPEVNYNIELKTQLKTDHIFHPHPEVFSDLVFQEISSFDLWDRVNIQSFDFRTLQYFNKKYPEVPLALLIENKLPWQLNIDSLGFVPAIYSCAYDLLSKEIVHDLKAENMKVIPWTVNEKQDIQKMIDWEVDGIISDYPNRVIELVKK